MTERELARELKHMKAFIKKLLRSKRACRSFLFRAGIIDKDGNLAEPYRQ